MNPIAKVEQNKQKFHSIKTLSEGGRGGGVPKFSHILQKRTQSKNGQRIWTDISPKTQMAKMYIRCSTIREIQIKTTWGIISHWSEWPLSVKSTNNKCWRGCGENKFLLHCWSDYKLVRPLWRTVWKFLKKLKLTTTRFNNPVPAFSKSSLYIWSPRF